MMFLRINKLVLSNKKRLKFLGIYKRKGNNSKILHKIKLDLKKLYD